MFDFRIQFCVEFINFTIVVSTITLLENHTIPASVIATAHAQSPQRRCG